ncbi:MAG: LacI family DNA-binding transcriptional regulator, partial [Eubacteriales bacterium]|nr:LacI family DNA-binding transcriptional regulator [Eubacteriales bacterium]
MAEKRGRLKSAEIAKIAGVSRSTVSRVVNGYSNVPEATKEHVMGIIKEYGYYPSFSGRVLAGKRT